MIWFLLYLLLGAITAVADVYCTGHNDAEDTLKCFLLWPLLWFFGSLLGIASLLQKIGHRLAGRR